MRETKVTISGRLRRFRDPNKPQLHAMRGEEDNAAITLVGESRRAYLEKKWCISYPRCLGPGGFSDFDCWYTYRVIMSYLGRWDPRLKLKFICLIYLTPYPEVNLT